MKFLSAAHMIGCALGCTLLFSATGAAADPLHRNHHRHAGAHTHRVVNKVVVARSAPSRTVTTVSAFSLNSLPAGYVRFLHDDETFYYSEGIYYQKKPHGFIIVKPRAGFRVATLPRGYRVLRERGATCYSFNNVRYRKHGSFFVVV